MKRRVLYPVYTEQKAGFSQLWDNYDSKSSIQFDIDSQLIKSMTAADTTLPEINFDNFQLFRKSKSCPLAPLFGGELRVKRNNRGEANAKSRGICLMLKVSCCTETTFVNYRDNWDQGRISLQIYYNYTKNVQEFFFDKFIKFGVSEKPGKARACKSEKARAHCNEKWSTLKKATEVAAKHLPEYLDNYRKCVKLVNTVRAKMFCISCDIQAKKHINIEKKEVTIKKEQFRMFVDSCWQYPILQFKYITPVFKAYFDYTTLIKPGSDLDLSSVEDGIGLIQTHVEECKKYVDDNNKKNGNAATDMMSNPNCVAIGEFFSTWVFFMPEHIRISPAHYRFIRNVVLSIGTPRQIEKLYKIIPTSVITKAQ